MTKWIFNCRKDGGDGCDNNNDWLESDNQQRSREEKEVIRDDGEEGGLRTKQIWFVVGEGGGRILGIEDVEEGRRRGLDGEHRASQPWGRNKGWTSYRGEDEGYGSGSRH